MHKALLPAYLQGRRPKVALLHLLQSCTSRNRSVASPESREVTQQQQEGIAAAVQDGYCSDSQLSSTSSKEQLHTKKKPGRKPGTKHSAATRARMAAAKKGIKRPDEVRERIRESSRSKKHTVETRFKMHRSALGRQHSPETRNKMSRTRLANFRASDEQVSAAVEPPVDVSMFSGMGMEVAVTQMVALRQDIADWMERYEQVYNAKPDLEATKNTHPHIYAMFVRYMGLRDYVRSTEH